eukprot:scaffold205972_cov32-Tisochrysis_lutea.AAC.1
MLLTQPHCCGHGQLELGLYLALVQLRMRDVPHEGTPLGPIGGRGRDGVAAKLERRGRLEQRAEAGAPTACRRMEELVELARDERAVQEC